jgi:hypothetical protein
MKRVLATVTVTVAAACGLIACGPKLTFEGSRVKLLTLKDEIGNCQPISNVDGVGGSQEKAEISIRNRAGTMNADRVVITDALESSGRVKLVGKAYSCSAVEGTGPNG